jgi:hypothetical protein
VKLNFRQLRLYELALIVAIFALCMSIYYQNKMRDTIVNYYREEAEMRIVKAAIRDFLGWETTKQGGYWEVRSQRAKFDKRLSELAFKRAEEIARDGLPNGSLPANYTCYQVIGENQIAEDFADRIREMGEAPQQDVVGRGWTGVGVGWARVDYDRATWVIIFGNSRTVITGDEKPWPSPTTSPSSKVH